MQRKSYIKENIFGKSDSKSIISFKKKKATSFWYYGFSNDVTALKHGGCENNRLPFVWHQEPTLIVMGD